MRNAFEGEVGLELFGYSVIRVFGSVDRLFRNAKGEPGFQTPLSRLQYPNNRSEYPNNRIPKQPLLRLATRSAVPAHMLIRMTLGRL